ncbi:MAG: glycerate kinase [Lactobacillus sp.]
MKFVIAPDSFKGSLTAKEVAEAIKTGISKIMPNADCVLVPMADGGEGTMQALVDASAGRILHTPVHDPLGRLVQTKFGLLGDGSTAVIEMAQASGLQYVDDKTRNPMLTSTLGTGELIKAALGQGVTQIIIGIGGSATNDGGAGMAQALGVKLLDEQGQELEPGGGNLGKLAKVDRSGLDPSLAAVKILVASDVTNPLTGPDGASAVFGPQKGASSEQVKFLDQNLKHYADIVAPDLAAKPGAGAAGGLGFGLMAFTNSSFQKGVDLVIDQVGLRQKMQGADFVITGEGRIDRQTKFGKTPYGVALLAHEVVPQAAVIVLAGNIGAGVADLYDPPIDAIFATPSGAKPLERAMTEGKEDIAICAENIARLIKKIKKQ